MYERYWNLKRFPFENSTTPEFFFASHSHQAALLKLQYVIENQHGAGLLVGETGAGKSTLIRQLETVLPNSYGPVIRILYPQLKPAELLSYLLAELDPEAGELDPRTEGLDRVLRLLAKSLATHTENGRHPILVVDDAQLIEHPGVFQALQMLLNFREEPNISFSLFLLGTHALLPQIQRVGPLNERIAVKAVIQPMTAEETARYINHRLMCAGRTETIFSADAIQSIYELSGGNPRRVNRMCDMALLVGFADQLSRINVQEIEAVAEEVYSVVPD